jgi:RNA polymerase sigma factor (sigma-70 family)
MATRGTVTRAVHDLRSDDPAVRDRAAQVIWERYFSDLLEKARIHLNRRLRGRVDAEDVLQSMFETFCRRQQLGEYDLANRDDLWNLLVTITLNKTRNEVGKQFQKKRDVARDQALPEDDETESVRWALEQMEASGASPAEAAVLYEALERRLEALDDPQLPELRQIALWKLEGYTNSEIADKLNCVERTVERKVNRIKAKWKAFEQNPS